MLSNEERSEAEIFLSYFAALCEALMLINENETPTKPANMDASELVRFVQCRGKIIHRAYLMSRIHWTDEELADVAAHTKVLFEGERLTAPKFHDGQEVLPEDRRKRKLTARDVQRLKAVAGEPAGRKSASEVRKLSPDFVALPIPTAGAPAELWSDQIIASLLQLNLQALELATAKVKAGIEELKSK